MKIIMTVLTLLIVSGCATRDFVRDQCWESECRAGDYVRRQKIDCLQYTADVEHRLNQIMRKSDIVREESVQLKDPYGFDQMDWPRLNKFIDGVEMGMIYANDWETMEWFEVAMKAACREAKVRSAEAINRATLPYDAVKHLNKHNDPETKK